MKTWVFVLLLCVALSPPGDAQVLVATGSAIRPLWEAWATFAVAVSPASISGTEVFFERASGFDALAQLQAGYAMFASTAFEVPAEDGFVSELWAVEGYAVVHNVGGLTGSLFMERETMVDIFLGKITRWNDPILVAQNPYSSLPDEEIIIVHRQERCGTTVAQSEVFSAFSEEWRDRFGVVDLYPEELSLSTRSFARLDSQGVVDALGVLHNGIAFTSLAFVGGTDLETSIIATRNRNGDVVTPTTRSLEEIYTAENAIDAPLPGAWPMASKAYVTFRAHYQFPLDEYCYGLKAGAAVYRTLASTQITDIIALSLGAVGTPREGRLAGLKYFDEMTCNGQLLSSFPDQPQVFVYPYLFGVPASEVELDYAMEELPEREPFFDSIGRTIEEADADPFVLPDLPEIYLYGMYDAEEAAMEAEMEAAMQKRGVVDDAVSSSASRTSSPVVLVLCLLMSLSLVTLRDTSTADASLRTRPTWHALLLAVVLVTVCAPIVVEAAAPQELHMAVLLDFASQSAYFNAEEFTAIQLAVEDINNDPTILPTTTFTFEPISTGGTLSGSAGAAISATRRAVDVILGPRDSTFAASAAEVAGLYGHPIVSHGATADAFADTERYPTFVRVVPSSTTYATAIAHLIARYEFGQYGVAVIATADADGIASTNELQRAARELGYDISGVVTVAADVDGEALLPLLESMRDTKARVFVSFVDGSLLQRVLKIADKLEMINDHAVWLTNSRGISRELLLTIEGSSVSEAEFIHPLLRGLVAIAQQAGRGDRYRDFLARWASLDPTQFWGVTRQPVSVGVTAAYDAVELIARGFDRLYREDREGDGVDAVLEILKNVTFDGLSAPIDLHGTRSNYATLGVYNYRSYPNGDRGFLEVGVWHEVERMQGSHGFDFSHNIVFHDNTTHIPDLDVRNEVEYWSCEDKELKVDHSGKEVRLDEPGRKAKYLADFYECDGFIDCYNMSDEWDCSASLPIGFIVVGVLIAVFLLAMLVVLFLVMLLWLVKKEPRIRKGMPSLMVLTLLACILILLSIFTVFGQPHDVSCVIQPWAMIIPVSVLVGVLCIRPISIYHHFRFPSHPKLNDWKMVVIVLLHCIPTVLLLGLWTLIATPSATLEKVDGEYHHVCASNGFAGRTGGIVIFVLICVYEGALLLLGATVSLLARRVIVPFNESRLTAVAIYNIGLCGLVGIPVYAVLWSNNVARWSVLVGALMYLACSTVLILFVPKLYSLAIVDPRKKKHAEELGVTPTSKDSRPSAAAPVDADNDLF